MLMPMLMMLVVMPMLLPNAFDDVEYVAVDLQNADAKMWNNVACHLLGCYAVRMLSMLLPLIRKLMM